MVNLYNLALNAEIVTARLIVIIQAAFRARRTNSPPSEPQRSPTSLETVRGVHIDWLVFPVVFRRLPPGPFFSALGEALSPSRSSGPAPPETKKRISGEGGLWLVIEWLLAWWQAVSARSARTTEVSCIRTDCWPSLRQAEKSDP